ncbi:hypothetical protein [Bowmanella denitrificans]|uniref:hypothetical protein n=1 Tax=Bowmanella denitrificans TaxID=366582 RepID=UPI000C9C8063|nr:hypothetical protein [Bowmanella denitrificans]
MKQKKLSDIINISNLPKRIEVNSDWDVSMLLTDFNYVNNKGYIPEVLCKELPKELKGSLIDISDLDMEYGKSTTYRVYETESVLFNCKNVDDYVEKTGAHNILIEFKRSNSFIIGLDREFILIVSLKTDGFLSAFGGVNWFETVFNCQKKKGSPAISQESLEDLGNAIYRLRDTRKS